MLREKQLKALLTNEGIKADVKLVLVAETVMQVMRERVDEYSKPIWVAHWAEHKQAYLRAANREPKGNNDEWWIENLADELLEIDWKAHISTAEWVAFEPAEDLTNEYYRKIDQAHKDNDNLPDKEGNCPALEAKMNLHTAKTVFFERILEGFEEIPELAPLSNPKHRIWGMKAKRPRPDNYTGILWTNRDWLIHTTIGQVLSSDHERQLQELSKRKNQTIQ